MLREAHRIVQLAELASTQVGSNYGILAVYLTSDTRLRSLLHAVFSKVLTEWRELDYSHATRYFYQPVSLDKITRASCSGMQFRNWIQ